MEDFEEALPTAREAVTEVIRMYDRVEAVRPKVNGSTASADSENTRERPLGAVPTWLESRLLQTVNDAALKVVRARAERLEVVQPHCGSPILESFLREENNGEGYDSKRKQKLLEFAYSVEGRQLYTAWKSYNSLPPLKTGVVEYAPRARESFGRRQQRVGEARGKLCWEGQVAGCRDDRRAEFVEASEARDRAQYALQHVRAKLGRHDLGLPAKMAALAQKRRPSSLECLGRHVRKPLFQ